MAQAFGGGQSTHWSWRKTSLSVVGGPHQRGFCLLSGASLSYWNHHWLAASEWRTLMLFPHHALCSEDMGQRTSLKPSQGCVLGWFASGSRFSSIAGSKGEMTWVLLTLTKPYLSKGSQKVRRGSHPPLGLSWSPFFPSRRGLGTLPPKTSTGQD